VQSVPGNGCLSIAGGTTAQAGAETAKTAKNRIRKPLQQNRKQKYGGNHANEFADANFLFDFVYIRGSISTPSGRL